MYFLLAATARLVEAMLRNEGLVEPVGTFRDEYGVTLPLPSVVGNGRVKEILQPQLSEAENEALGRSAAAIRSALDQSTF